MSDATPSNEDSFVEKLVALDEAMASGGVGPSLSPSLSDSELPDLERSANCLKLLRKYAAHARPTPSFRQAIIPTLVGLADEDDRCGEVSLPRMFGRFEIKREIGRGGYGVVFLAYDPQLRRDIALKVPHANVLTQPELQARFKREAVAAASLDHPNIVQIYEAGEIGPISYIAAAYCPGLNLAEWLHNRDVLPAYHDSAVLVASLADAVEHAHRRGVFHRDIKPANIILQTTVAEAIEAPTINSLTRPKIGDPRNRPFSCHSGRITDFGLAKTLDGTSLNTLSGAILGTPSYMAPEQATRGAIVMDAQADIYSLGAVLYQLITGCVPFQSDSPLETLRQVVAQDPVAPRKLRSSVPMDLETICLKCLEKNPAQRYGSAQELAEDLRLFIRAEPIKARRISEFERALRFCRRRPLATSLSLALCSSVVIGLIVTSWLWRDSEANRIRAVGALSTADSLRLTAVAQRDRSERMLYLHDIALSQRESTSNLDRSLQLLANAKPEYRNWEWHYLNQLVNTPLLTLVGHTMPVQNCLFTPDGQYLVSSTGYWTSQEPGEVFVWEAKSGKIINQIAGLQHSVMGLAVHPNSQWIAVPEFSWDHKTNGILRIFDIASGQELATIAEAVDSYAVAFSPNGEQLAAVNFGGMIRLIDTTTWQVKQTIQDQLGNVFSVAYAPDGMTFATCGRDGTVSLWRTSDGVRLFRIRPYSDSRLVRFSPDGKLLAISSFGGEIKLWDLQRNCEVSTVNSRDARIPAFRFSPDGRYLCFGSQTSGFQIVEVASGRIVRELPSHYPTSFDLSYSPDGSCIATAGSEGKVRIWDLTRSQGPRSKEIQGSYIADAVRIPETELLALASKKHATRSDLGIRDFTARVIDPKDYTRRYELKGHTNWLTSMAVDSAGKFLLTGSEDDTARLWDLQTGKEHLVLSGHGGSVSDVAFCSNDSQAVTADADGKLRYWDVTSGQEVDAVQAHASEIHCIAYSQPFNALISTDENGVLKVWDCNTRKLVTKIQAHAAAALAIAISRDGRTIASAGKDKHLRLWALEQVAPTSGQLIVQELQDVVVPEQIICALDFSPDASRIVTGSLDGSVRIWDCESGSEAIRLDLIEMRVANVLFSRDGQQLFAACGNRLKTFDANKDLTSSQERLNSLEKSVIAWHRSEASAAERDFDGFAALNHLDALLKSDPSNLRLISRRANAIAELGDWNRADEEFNRARNMGDKELFVQYERALIKRHLGDDPGFRQIYEDCRKEYSESNKSVDVNNLAWMATMSSEELQDFEPILHRVEQSLAREKDKSMRFTLLDTKAMLLYRLNRFAEAAEAISISIKAHGRGGDFNNLLLKALIDHEMGNTQEARNQLASVELAMKMSAGDRVKPIAMSGSWYSKLENARLLRQTQLQIDENGH